MKEWNELSKTDIEPLYELSKQRIGSSKKITSELDETLEDYPILFKSKHSKVSTEEDDDVIKAINKMRKEKNRSPVDYLKGYYDDLSINGKFETSKELTLPSFFHLRQLSNNMEYVIDHVENIGDKYGNPENLIPDNPIQEDWYKRIIDRILLQAVKEDKDFISIAQSHIVNQRYGGQGENTKKYLYDKLFPAYLKKLAKKYNTKVEKKAIDPKDISDEPFEFYDTFSGDILDVEAPYDKKELFNVNVLKITPELRKKILSEGVKTFAMGGLVVGEDNVPFTKEDPADRVDPNTGKPYSDQMARLGFSEGGNVLPTLIFADDNKRQLTQKEFNRMIAIDDYLKGKGYRKEARAGILGNIHIETGGSFSPTQIEQAKDKQLGYGIFQLTGKKKDFNNWMTENKFNKETVDELPMQIEYMHETIYGNELIGKKRGREIGDPTASRLQKSFATGTPEEIALSFSNEWEKPRTPHNKQRIQAASTIFNIIN